jgi:hypothetical protein
MTQYNADAHNTHAHSPLWIHVRKSYPYEHLRRTKHRRIWRFPKSPMSPRRKIQKKVWAPGFKPWWVAFHCTVLPLDYKTHNCMSQALPLSFASSNLCSPWPRCNSFSFDRSSPLTVTRRASTGARALGSGLPHRASNLCCASPLHHPPTRLPVTRCRWLPTPGGPFMSWCTTPRRRVKLAGGMNASRRREEVWPAPGFCALSRWRPPPRYYRGRPPCTRCWYTRE